MATKKKLRTGELSMAKKKAMPKDRLAGRTPDMQLYRAVRRYVESKGGKIVVIGGIEIQEWPGEGKYKFRVAVRLLGKRPPPPRSPSRPDNLSTGPALSDGAKP